MLGLAGPVFVPGFRAEFPIGILPEKGFVFLVAEWIHFILFGVIVPTIQLKAYTFWGL